MLVSVLVPFFNVEDFIERCAKSLFEQTYPHLEYVFVDDCSTDRSMNKLREVASRYPGKADSIHYVRNGKNLGLACCRNIAMSHATGEFMSIVDADDWTEPHMIERMVERQKETDADIVSVDTFIHRQKGSSELKQEVFQEEQERKLYYIGHIPCFRLTIWGRLIRRSLFTENNIKTINGFNYAEDKLTITLLMYYAKTVSNVTTPLYHYNRMNEKSYVGKIEKYGFSHAIFQEEKGNLLALEHFFADKEHEYYEESLRCNINYFLNKLRWALQHSSELVYEECVNYLYRNPAVSHLLPASSKEKARKILCSHLGCRHVASLQKLVRRIKRLKFW